MSEICNLGSRIKKYRARKNLTQEKFSELVNISLKYLQSIESGKETPSLELFNTICDTLCVLPSQLITNQKDDFIPDKKYENLSTSSLCHANDIALSILSHLKEAPRSINEMLGMRIATARNEQGFSRKELARKAGISVTHLGNIETGIQFTTIKTLCNIKNEVNASIEYLVQDGCLIAAQENFLATLSRAEKILSPEELKCFNKIIDGIIELDAILSDK